MSITLNDGSRAMISLGAAASNICSLTTSSIRTNWFLTLGGEGIYLAIRCIAQTLSTQTGGRLQLNRLVSFPLRSFIYNKLGKRIGTFTEDIFYSIKPRLGLGDMIMGLTTNQLIRGIIINPIVEEIIFRLPLLAGGSIIDTFFCTSTRLSRVVPLVAGQILKTVLAILNAFVFVYMHHITPSPGRAAGLFVSGLIFSYLALQHSGGFINAIVAHSVSNLATLILERP